jgi:tetratricopeptide (TPR) repeat protein
MVQDGLCVFTSWGGWWRLGAWVLLLGGVLAGPAVGGEEDSLALARRAQQEFFGSSGSPASYEGFEKALFNEAFLKYQLSQSQRARYQEAIASLQGPLQRAEEGMLRGILHLGLHQTEAARQAFHQALEIDPTRAEVYPQLSEVYRQEGRLQEALQAADEAIQRTPEEAYPYAQRAAVRADQHDYEGALTDLEQAEARDPNLPEIHLGRGLIYLRTGRTAPAVEAFQSALQNDPSYLRARVLLGVAYLLEGQPELAIAQAEQVLGVEPDYPSALFLRGALAEDNGDHEAAIAAYRQVLEADPEQDYAAYRLGRQWAILNRPQAARDAFAALVQAAPNVPMLHLQLGLAYQQLGNLPEAIREFQEAWQQRPQMAYAALPLALALHAAGQPEPAFATLAEAAQRFPQEPQVFEVLYRLLQETPVATGPSYQQARSALFRQRGSRTRHFLDAVEELVREQGRWEDAQPALAEGRRFLEEGEVIRAEQQGAAVCEEWDLGFAVKLGPEDQESGLHRLELDQRDGGTQPVVDLGGRPARWTQVDNGHHYIYLDVVEERSPSQGAWVLVEYWDDSNNRFLIHYDSTEADSWFQGAYKATESVWKGDTQSWRCYVFWLPDAAFQGRQHGGADFRIFSRGWQDTAVHSVRVLIP